jgi:hypothetical protein
MVDDDDYPGGWFGESWYAPVCESARHRPTPVGDICQCGKAIEVGDQGMLIPLISSTAELLSWHLDCFLASVLPRARAYDLTKARADG